MRWTPRRRADERRQGGRRSRVVLTSRRWRQALRMTARRRWQTSPITGKRYPSGEGRLVEW